MKSSHPHKKCLCGGEKKNRKERKKKKRNKGMGENTTSINSKISYQSLASSFLSM
jgi:hypothetical protein